MGNKNKNAASGGRSRSLLTMLMFMFAVAACAMAGYLVWDLKFAKSDAVAVESPATPVVADVEPLYLSMNTFTVSLKPTASDSDRVLFIGISVRLTNRQSLLTLEKYLPEYRSRIFMLLTQQTYDALSTDDGKKQLITSINNELNKPLAYNQSIGTSDVLINEFILR